MIYPALLGPFKCVPNCLVVLYENYLMVLYENYLICIFMNINEILK